jgi:hypothetical protein
VIGLFGGNQATIVTASTLITQLQDIRTNVDSSRFGILVNGVILAKSDPYYPNTLPVVVTLQGPIEEGIDPITAKNANLLQGATV